MKIQIIASNSIGRAASFNASSDKPAPGIAPVPGTASASGTGSIPDPVGAPKESPTREHVSRLLDTFVSRLLTVLPADTRVSFGAGIGTETETGTVAGTGAEFAEVYVKPFYGIAFIIEFWQDEETAGPDDIELRLSRYLGDTGVTEIVARERIDFSRTAEAGIACTACFDQLLLLAERSGK